MLEMDHATRSILADAVRRELQMPARRVTMFRDLISRTYSGTAAYGDVSGWLEELDGSVGEFFCLTRDLDDVTADTLDSVVERMQTLATDFRRSTTPEQIGNRDIRTYAGFIEENLGKISALTGEFLGVEGEQQSLAAALQFYRAQLEHLTIPKRVGIVIDLDCKDVVLGESYRDVFTAFLSNAVEHGYQGYSSDKRRVVVRGRKIQGEGSYFVSVTDNGRGVDIDAVHAAAIDAELTGEDWGLNDQSKLDLVFSKGVSTSNGEGLGLHRADQIVRKYGGLRGVTSQRGIGATFYVKIPRNLVVSYAEG